MRHFDRVYYAPGWIAATSGYHAVIACPPPEHTFYPGLPCKPAHDALAASTQKWLFTETRPVDGDRLQAFVKLPDCPLCKNARETTCKACDGTGGTKHRCMTCDDEHDCICTECRSGKRECACAKDAPVRILGEVFNRVLVDDLMKELQSPVVSFGLAGRVLVLVARSGRRGVAIGMTGENPTGAYPTFEERRIG